MRRHLSYMLLSALLLVLGSCTHKELCLYHAHDARVSVLADWSKFTKETPTGMTVMMYPQDGGEAVKQHTNTISHATMHLPEGTYNSIIINQSADEFGSMEFKGMDSYGTAAVYTKSTKSSWYHSKADNEEVAVEPEWLATDRIESLGVTAEMVESTGVQVLSRSSDNGDLGYVLGSHTPMNIVNTINITVHLKGFQNYLDARASLDGLAAGYIFSTGRPTGTTVTQLIEGWRKEKDRNDPTRGTISATMTCFGLPDGHGATAEENTMTLWLLLADNKPESMMEFTFKVGDKFVYEYDSDVDVDVNVDLKIGMTLELEIEIEDPLPDVKPENGASSGFDVTVDGWGDVEEIDVIL